MTYQFGLEDNCEGIVSFDSVTMKVAVSSTDSFVLNCLHKYPYGITSEFGDEYDTIEIDESLYVRKYRRMPYFINSLQYMAILHIEAASYIDYTDDKWRLYTLHKSQSHEFVAFCTVYRFFKFPQGIRARISQFLVSPVFHRQGYGSKFYIAIISDLGRDHEIKDVTVESPADTFLKMKIKLDAALLSSPLSGILSTKDRQVAKEYKMVLDGVPENIIFATVTKRLSLEYGAKKMLSNDDAIHALSDLVSHEVEFLKSIKK